MTGSSGQADAARGTAAGTDAASPRKSGIAKPENDAREHKRPTLQAVLTELRDHHDFTLDCAARAMLASRADRPMPADIARLACIREAIRMIEAISGNYTAFSMFAAGQLNYPSGSPCRPALPPVPWPSAALIAERADEISAGAACDGQAAGDTSALLAAVAEHFPDAEFAGYRVNRERKTA